MVAGMTACATFSGTSTRASSGSPAADLSVMPTAHAVALAPYFASLGGAPSDALVAETRRHLGGCLLAMETALRLALEREPGVADVVAALPEPLCWPTVCAQPGLVSPALLAHMRLRAGVSLILREQGKPNGETGDQIAAEDLFGETDGPAREAATLLTMAEWRWAAPGGEAQPLRPDLPAEHYAELLWTAVACILAAPRDPAALGEARLLDACRRAAGEMLAQHDEAASPIAAAHRLVRLLGARADGPDWLGRALGERRFLLFAALAGRRLQMEPERLIAILLDGPAAQVAVLCHALGGTGGDLRHLLLTLRSVRPGLTDGKIIAQAEDYETLEERDVAAAMALLRAPTLLGAKLDCLRGRAAAA